MKEKTKKILFISALSVLILIGVGLRLYHIEFGLPHSFHADEPEIAELAIKYTYELRDIIKNHNYQKLIPISFVYGTFPSYLFTLVVMSFSKTSNLLNIPFSKETLYIFMRSFNAVLSMGIILSMGVLFKKLFNNKTGILAVVFLTALNWKLIVHAHYINVDILLALLLSFCFLGAYLYYKHDLDNLHVVIIGLLYGVAVGTKVTALISLPLFLYLFLVKKDYRGLFGFLFLIFIGYAVTNPFSFIFAEDFAYRVYMMQIKEAGLVFDSVDSNPLKYLLALGYVTTPLVLALSVFGSVLSLRRGDRKFHIFLVGNILIYLIFYSLNSRRVDRWLLPILPIVLLYSAEGIHQVLKRAKKKVALVFVLLALGTYSYFPYLLLSQFQRDTPKSAAYKWAKDNLPVTSNKLAVTEEGLDPLNKLEGILVKRSNVYEPENAQFDLPETPTGYDFVIISSKPMRNFKKKEVKERFGFYVEAWTKFEDTILDGTKFTLIKQFTLPKPNLVELSDVYIYQSNTYK
ncbi:MAG: hypothetical protein WC243_01595 [Patescibacteria group bacterium]|jgi:hypothetical protein